jgi:uncharacterized protein
VFDWDQGNEQHVMGHGILPAEAEQAIDDPYALATDAYDVAGERRFALVGETEDGRLLEVVYTWRGDRRRIVTAFPARARERRRYAQNRGP